MALALCPATPLVDEADETEMVFMVFEVLDDEEAMLVETMETMEGEEAILVIGEDELSTANVTEPTNPKVIAVTEVRLEVTVVTVEKIGVTTMA